LLKKHFNSNFEEIKKSYRFKIWALLYFWRLYKTCYIWDNKF
jgi:hypothetical protein